MRVEMGTRGFLARAAARGVIAQVVASDAQERESPVKPDVIAKLGSNQDVCELRAVTTTGELFVSLLMAGGM